jgi:hypothetical protein
MTLNIYGVGAARDTAEALAARYAADEITLDEVDERYEAHLRLVGGSIYHHAACGCEDCR